MPTILTILLQFDFISIESRFSPSAAVQSDLSSAVARLFSAWIGGIAALIFLPAFIAALCGAIGWMQLLYVYVGVAAMTLLLACTLCLSRRKR
jgi:hypothetical protein